MQALYILALLLCYCKVSCGSPQQIVNSNGFHAADSTIKKYATGRALHPMKKLRTLSVLDCTGTGDCKLVNKMLDTSFRNVNGISLDITKDTAILYAAFNTTISTKFCGAKAVDYQCLLSSSEVQPCVTIAMAASDLELALRSYDQLFRRLLKFKHDSVSEDRSKELLTITVLLDESGVDTDADCGVEHYAGQIEAFLRQLWTEQYDKKDFPASLKVEVVLVRAEEPAMLERARASLRTILQEHSRALTIKDNAPESGVESVGEEGEVVRGVPAEQLASVLTQTWKAIPRNVHPVLSLAQREALYEIESAATSGRSQADAAIRQWQTRVAKGRTVGKFSSRVEQLLAALRKDFYQRTSSQAAVSLVRERGDRLQALRQHVLGSAGRLFLQQLVVLEFHCLAGFKRQLGKLIAREDLDEAELLKEQEQVELRKALFDFRAQASDLEDPALGFVVSPDRIAELTSTLEAVLAEFPDTPSAKLEEVRKMERMAQRGKLATTPRTGKGRKRKGIAKALGVTLGLVGMLRPAGFGNLQGYVGYMTSLLGLPLEMMLGVQNDGETPEIKGEDREHPLLRLQPKLKFEIDL